MTYPMDMPMPKIYNPETKTYVDPFADAPRGEYFVPLERGTGDALIVRGLDGNNYHRSATVADASWVDVGSPDDLTYAVHGYQRWRSLGVHGGVDLPESDPFEGAPLGVQLKKTSPRARVVVTADGKNYLYFTGEWKLGPGRQYTLTELLGYGWKLVGDTTPVDPEPEPDRFAGAPYGDRFVRNDDEAMVVADDGSHWLSWYVGDLWHRVPGNDHQDFETITEDWGWTHLGEPVAEPEQAPEPVSRVIVLNGGGDRWFYDAGKDRYYAIAPGNPNFPAILSSEDFREKVLSTGYHTHNSADRTYSTVLSG